MVRLAGQVVTLIILKHKGRFWACNRYATGAAYSQNKLLDESKTADIKQLRSSSESTLKVLFITRTYPPLVGGMEKFASDFFNNYRRIGEIDLLANSRGKKSIIPFLLQVMMSIMFNGRKYDVVHLYDAVLFPLIPFIRLFSKAKISFTVNGLDIVYSSFGYQKVMPLFFA